MYDFHYNFIKKYFGAELLFADRYSLTYEIKSEDVYKEVFNTSTCLISVTIQKIQIFLILPIKKMVGKWKMELIGWTWKMKNDCK